MASTFTNRLRLAKQGDNDNPETWGDVLNEQVIDLLDEAVAGFLEKDITGSSDVDISSTTVNGGSDDARNMTLKLSGNITTNIDFIVPAQEKIYVVHMTATGGNVTFRPTGGTGPTLVTNQLALIYIDGTDAYLVNETAESVPSGAIIMWSGSISSIPAGYVFCDGTNGTPDLRDRFIVGARIDETGTAKSNITGSLAVSGGSLSATISGTTGSGGAFSGSTASHTLTLSQIPSHNHGILMTSNGVSSGLSRVSYGDGFEPQVNRTDSSVVTSAGGNGGHSHGLTIPSHTHTLDNATATIQPPPYYAIAYIMKI